MESHQETENKPSGREASMKEMWDAAAKAFEDICGESLQRGDIKGFHDVQVKIEGVSKASYDTDSEQQDKWNKAKNVGLKSLQYLKMLVSAASEASSVIPIPASAAKIASGALCFVFDIPEAIKGYNDAINQVFGEVSSALSQFHIYTSIQNVDPELIRRIHLVMISFVKLCAHVVKYRQGRKRGRLLRQIKSIFDDDSGLGDEMTEFKRVLQQQRDVEGTVTLAVVADTHELVQETQKDVQFFKDDANRSKSLIKIRDTLGVWATVRLDTNTTQTCTDIYDKCYNLTGSWIWAHDAYTAWSVPNKDKETSHILILSGPASSGKTSASALITKRLEEQKGRTYVAHYFFPPSTKKSDDEKISPVHSALKYMAFQIARVDIALQKPLGKACDAGPGIFRRLASLETLDALWTELKIGTPGSGGTYYLIFDGLENLPDKQVEILLKFIFGSKLTESAGRVRVLVSGTDDQFASRAGGAITSSALRIRMEEHNGPDMRIVVDEELTKRGLLEHAKPGSDQQRARDKIIEKLPQNVSGSYSRLQFALDDVVRLLSTRTAAQELDRMLDQPISSHEAAIKNLQRSLTEKEIGELNELLKWVLYCNGPMTLDQLEAAMFLYSGTESLASLQFIVKNKYSAVLRLEKGYVYGQDGVQDYLQKDKDISGKSAYSKDRSTISMTITINNVDQELCGHFLWDLAHKAIRDKFKFDFDASSPNSALHSSNQAAIKVDEFEAHHTIVTRAFEFLDMEHKDQTREIGGYLVGWLPHHLGRLRQLEDEEKGALTPGEQMEIGQNLYKLFKDEKVFLRHKTSFEKTMWYVDEMEGMKKWIMDSAVVRKLDKKWRDEVQQPVSPTKSLLKELVKLVVEGLLRERCWEAQNAYFWIREFMELDKEFQQTPKRVQVDEAKSSESTSSPVNDSNEIDWEGLSAWCQNFLGLPDSKINSLWYERLAETLSSQNCKASTVLCLYERAIAMENPSWLCHHGLGKTHFIEGRIQKAIAHIDLALKTAEQEGATPKPKTEDVIELHLLLGRYLYEAGNMQKAAEHYLFACESEDLVQARQGQLGSLKAELSFLDADAIRQLLKSTLAKEVGERTLASVLKMIARDTEHDIVISKIFTVAKDDPDLLRGIVRAMETATATAVLNEGPTGEITEDSLFAEDEARGVLLYDRGVAAYMYNMSSDGTEAVGEALRLWRESRDLLSNVGGRNALIVRQDATAALAKHYFQDMMDGNHLDHADELVRLTGAETGTTVYYDDAAGFLGTAYALQGKKEQARAVLVRWMRQGFRILSDDIPENDVDGFAMILKTLEHYQDFKNAAFALSLGAPDIITNALFFETKDVVIDDVDKARLLDTANKLAEETIQIVKAQFPNASQQARRIEAAKAHVDSLIAATGSKSNTEPDRDHSETEGSEVQGESTTSDLERAFALDLLHSRLSTLQQKYSSEIDTMEFEWDWSCDGRTTDGKQCENRYNSEREMYHCIYCRNRDFCGDCLVRLRVPNSGAGILACSANHRWLRIPPFGDAMFVGSKVKSVRVPKEVRATKDDERILEICYDENGSEEITVEAWKEALAREWNISLEEIRKEISRQATPDRSEQGERKDE